MSREIEFSMALDELAFAEQAARNTKSSLDSTRRMQRRYLIDRFRDANSQNWEVRDKFAQRQAGYRIALRDFECDLAEAQMVSEAWRAHLAAHFLDEWTEYQSQRQPQTVEAA